MSVLVGVDVGGSKTTAAGERDGEPIGRHHGPGAALQPGRVLRSATTIADVVRRVVAETGTATADVLVVGAAGAGRAEERNELARALRAEEMARRVQVTTDGEIALLAAHGTSPGILVIAGTGSVALAQDPAGTVHAAGGHGWQMGDEGSGYALGRAALGAVSRAADGRGPATALSQTLLSAARCASYDRLVRWAAAAGPGEVAALARPVQETADEGDEVALALVRQAAADLLSLVEVLRRRFPDEGAVPVACSGGLLAAGSAVRRQLEALMTDDAAITVLATEVDAASGALLLARQLTTEHGS